MAKKMKITAEVVKEHGLSEDEYQIILDRLGREPNINELGIFSVMWSEHCSYKSSRRHLGKFLTTGDKVIQGPGENAGVIDIGDGDAIIFKMESHNHPSYIEPYQGAATGVGGIMRDVFTMGARRDGIHGATMASAEFDDDSEEKRPTVQVGDPFTEKLLIEACLELMATDAIIAIQDMGAAGLTSSSIEMADKGGVGVEINLDKVPTRQIMTALTCRHRLAPFWRRKMYLRLKITMTRLFASSKRQILLQSVGFGNNMIVTS